MLGKHFLNWQKDINREKFMEKIAIIGHFGGKKEFNDGQTVKTLTLYRALKSTKLFGIYKIDTYYNKTNKIKLLYKTIIGLLTCKKIIILLSQNVMKLYFHLLYWSKKILGTQVYHDVLGGKLDVLLKRHNNWSKYISSFVVNWVELPSLYNILHKQGIKNVQLLPNFKNLQILKNENKKINSNMLFWKICTFSRVCEEKGITHAIETLAKIKEQYVNFNFKLDIWGPIEEKYKTTFDSLLQSNSFTEYKGVVHFNNSVEVLSQYDILLFPTHWHGEGFPGTLIDAFAAGLPSIATDWNGNKEIISHKKTGILYPWQDILTLQDGILWAFNNSQKWQQMQFNCLNEAKKYTVSACLPMILEKLQVYKK